MNVPIHHRVAVVTGAAGGLGHRIAVTLGRKGHRILLTDLDSAPIDQAVSDLQAEGIDVFGQPLDVRDERAFERALDAVTHRWGGAGVLVNNAAVTRATAVFDITPDEFSEVLQVNLRGTFIGCQVFGRAFRAQRWGRIINIASLAGQNGGTATGAHYAASKGGIVTLTKVFAKELAGHGVTVNAIAPGPLDLPVVHRLLSPEKLQGVVARIPVGHLGDPAFIGDLVALLATAEAASVTGATYDANGGLNVR